MFILALTMVFKSSPDLNHFLNIFKRRFVEIFLAVIFIAIVDWRRIYRLAGYEFNLLFWAYQLVILCLFALIAAAYFKPDLTLFNCTVTEFSIDAEYISLTTATVKIPLFVNKPSFEMKLKMHEFSRDKIILPTRVFSKEKYPAWELRNGDITVYIIARFYTPEAWNELEKFLYWKDISQTAKPVL